MLTDKDAQRSCHTSPLCSFPSMSPEYVAPDKPRRNPGTTTNTPSSRFPNQNTSHIRPRIRRGIMRFLEYVAAPFPPTLYDNIFGVHPAHIRAGRTPIVVTTGAKCSGNLRGEFMPRQILREILLGTLFRNQGEGGDANFRSNRSDHNKQDDRKQRGRRPNTFPEKSARVRTQYALRYSHKCVQAAGRTPRCFSVFRWGSPRWRVTSARTRKRGGF